MLPESSHFEQLFAAACAYHMRGWSVIPVLGDAQPDCAKAAAVAWGEFQHHRPTVSDMSRWLLQERYPGLAVVTGAVSRLLMLDFDAESVFQDFQRQYPELATTYTVRTRRGCHLYFQLPLGLKVSSKKADGVDLQAEGRYVVAPPTMIADHTYCVSEDAPPRLLRAGDIARIEGFLEAQGTITPSDQPAREFAPSIRDSEASRGVPESLSQGDLLALYRSLVQRGSRNEALFRVSLRARDAGWTGAAVMGCLAETHARQPAAHPHRSEAYTSRCQEAIRTAS